MNLKLFITRLAFAGAMVTLLLGLACFFFPYFMVEVIGFDFLLGQGRGVSEMRAVYGMLFIAMGAVMIWALIFRSRGAPYLRFAGILWLATGLGRFLSMVIDGAWLPYNFTLLTLELFLGIPILMSGFQNTETSFEVGTSDEATEEREALPQ